MTSEYEYKIARQALAKRGRTDPSERDLWNVVHHHTVRRCDPGVDWEELWDEAAVLTIGFKALLSDHPATRGRAANDSAAVAGEHPPKHAG